MYKKVVMSLLLLVCYPAYSADTTHKVEDVDALTVEDTRQFVEMPVQAREYMRLDMLDHLLVLSQVMGHLAANEFDAAADLAEARMGRSAMGQHRGDPNGPGRFMPLEMRNIGWGMHAAATEFANVARRGDAKDTYTALQHLTNSCIGCHYSYRTR
ncbi:cytochrome C [Pseudomonas sp. C27(2019)]|uniref:cytochrome c n=1 Tax=Pseudomonas sp. C27(2019) TaxID=2604941 RepID=UPI001244E0F3|nr:cytochrome c [Pseudomonas sp. C27(2019)]QEY58411.1 cytochrome C [Pseudomonas sp. C27(2019)]